LFRKLNPIFLKRIVIIFCFACVSLSGATDVFAQDDKDISIPLEKFYVDRNGIGLFRKIISKVTIGISTGYGSTKFKHDLSGFGILQNPDSLPRIFAGTNSGNGNTNWFNTSTYSTATSQPGSSQIDANTTKLGFKSKAFNIPIKATLHVEFDRYRIGGGYSIEYTHIGTFKPTAHGDQINNYTPEVSSLWLKKYFGMVGGTVYRYYEYSLVVDAQVGGYGLGNSFDKSLIKKGVFINLGATVERDFSEYFRVFVRPSYELKSYKISLPELGQSVTHKFNAFYINIGASYRFPELRRCVVKTCKAQMNHAHGNREYRSRVHPIYKKQNPHYGENHPVLIKYKGKNKRKIDPY